MTRSQSQRESAREHRERESLLVSGPPTVGVSIKVRIKCEKVLLWRTQESATAAGDAIGTFELDSVAISP
jgi:hypothetical protein